MFCGFKMTHCAFEHGPLFFFYLSLFSESFEQIANIALSRKFQKVPDIDSKILSSIYNNLKIEGSNGFWFDDLNRG